MSKIKPKGCIYPKCLECPLPDCSYDKTEQEDVVFSKELDREISYDNRRRKAEMDGRLQRFLYDNSPKGRERSKKYNRSEKGRERSKRQNEKRRVKIKDNKMSTIKQWLNQRNIPYKIVEKSYGKAIKLNRYIIKYIDNHYIVGIEKFDSQKSVINDFIIPNCGKSYKKVM